jgi:hypothetical protein
VLKVGPQLVVETSEGLAEVEEVGYAVAFAEYLCMAPSWLSDPNHDVLSSLTASRIHPHAIPQHLRPHSLEPADHELKFLKPSEKTNPS